MAMELLKQLVEGGDHHRLLAAHVLGKKPEDVTREERYRFKDAFYALFHYRGPEIIKDCLEDLRELDGLPEVRKYLREKAKRT